MRTYILYPEYFCANSIARAEIVFENASIIRRKLVPKMWRRKGHFVYQNIEKLGSRYIFHVEKEPDQGFFPAVDSFTVSLLKDSLHIDITLDEEPIILKENNSYIYNEDGIRSYFENVVNRLATFMEKQATSGQYQKRVYHDQVVSKGLFQDFYMLLKQKFGEHLSKLWVAGEMKTDPGKHIHEDLAIATFLILCFIQEPNVNNKKNYQNLDSSRFHSLLEIISLLVEINEDAHDLWWGSLAYDSFVDMGAGNGLLVWLLNVLGIKGYGCDIHKRKLWDHLSHSHYNTSSVGYNMIEGSITPDFILKPELVTEDIWVIGNHSDELTPWIPLLTCNLNNSGLHARFVVIPCCFHDIYGFKNVASNWIVPFGSSLDEFDDTLCADMDSPIDGRYSKYLRYIERLSRAAGFKTCREYLRIPSTKNIALVGTPESCDRMAEYASRVLSTIPFKCRLTDREKTLNLMAKRMNRLAHPGVNTREQEVTYDFVDWLNGSFDF